MVKTKKRSLSIFLTLLFAFALVPALSAKTLKIGLNYALNWPLGIDGLKTIELDIEKVNKAGGLNIGGEKYLIELVVVDNKMDIGLAKTVTERLIFKDEVKFMLGDGFMFSYLDLADANKLLTIASGVVDSICLPKYKYMFRASAVFMWASLIQWMAEHYPNYKSYTLTMPDRIDGRAYEPYWRKNGDVVGLKSTVLFYPPTSVDHSALGTKIKSINSDMLIPFGGGPQTDSLIIKAARAAGYNGQIVNTASIPGGVMMGIAGPEAIEGMISIAWPFEFDDPVTPLAKEFKEDWIAKYGAWTFPEPAQTLNWYLLKAAFAKASSPNPDEIAEILASGLKYDSPLGSGMMVARRDLGNNRTVEMNIEGYIKKIEHGKIKYIGKMDAEQVYQYCIKALGW